MPSLKIDTGEIRLTINDDPTRVIAFNPADATFAERFYKVVGEFQAKVEEYNTRAQALKPELDADGIALVKDTCLFVRDRIDYVFGAGTSQKAFGDALVLDVFSQFFDGIMPFIQTARADKLAQYIPQKKAKRRKV